MTNNKTTEKGKSGLVSGRGSTKMAATPGSASGKQLGKKNNIMTAKGGKEELYKEKCKSLKRRCIELEEQNGLIERRLKHSKRLVTRLRLERSFLFDKLEQFEKTKPVLRSDYSSGSSSSSDDSDTESGSSESEAPVTVVEAPKVTKTSTRTKAEKDPHAPKRPANAFFMYCQHHRAAAQEEFTDLRHPEITKILGQRWQQMSEQEKQPYFDMYENDKTRYARDLKQYTKGEIATTFAPTQPSAPIQAAHARLAANPSDLELSSSSEDVE